MPSRFYRFSWWVVFILFKLFLRLRVRGANHVPMEGPVILASNHASYVDPPLVGVSTRRELAFFAKSELFAVPILGPIITRLNAIPVRRGTGDRRALSAVIETLQRGKAVLLFPEGTRTVDGRRRKDGGPVEVKPGLGLIATATGLPIVPLHIRGTDHIWKTLIGLQQAEVSFGEPLRPSEFPHHPDRKETYHLITQEVMRRIEHLKEAISSQRTSVSSVEPSAVSSQRRGGFQTCPPIRR